MKTNFLLLVFCISGWQVIAQGSDSLRKELPAAAIPVSADYAKPKLFSFLTDIPRDVAGFARASFRQRNFSNLGILTGATAFLYFSDQAITNTVQDKFEDNNIRAKEDFKPLLSLKMGGKKTNIGKLPRNFNTALYDIGQGSSAMLLAAGFYALGKIKHDNRALQTARQLTQAFITLGAGTQLMKYITGRENPSDATVARGRWRPFPGWKNFQHDKTRYDAFPSGHMATFISAVTIISENYPEKRWIRPAGYFLGSLCGLCMINNGVHWASDFPLGIALGYGYGKYIAHHPHPHKISPAV